MSMAASHPSLPTPFAHSNYGSGPIEHKHSISSNGTAMSVSSIPGSGTPRIGSSSEPPHFHGQRGNYRYTLWVDQQPVRARMCGFGDKDRRPITPPPCIRIVITDLTTGRPVPPDDVDSSFFVLSVDLWDEHGNLEKNVVRASSNSPATSISTATTTGFPPQPDRPVYAPSGVSMYSGAGFVTQPPAGQYPPGGYPPGQGLPPMYSGNGPPGYFPPGYQQQYSAAPSPGSPAYNPAYSQAAPGYPVSSQNQQGNMFTRNLIGNLTVNAFQLTDDKKQKGHWFILQDLSVRTEGVFRLKMSFIDMGTHNEPTKKSEEDNKLNTGKEIPILASVFSQPFQVFSAKKFPGVIESTPLSRAFANQGIKIPIRKDGSSKDRDDDGDDSQL